MSPLTDDDPVLARLRALARKRLRDAAAAGSGTVLSPAAMAVLMRLATSAEHAADALVLQQELQLHQIEIDALVEDLLAAQRGDPHEAPA